MKVTHVSTPLGRERVQFNAHRIFAPETVLDMFDELELMDYAMVNDAGGFIDHGSPTQASHCDYSCDMFEFVKK